MCLHETLHCPTMNNFLPPITFLQEFNSKTQIIGQVHSCTVCSMFMQHTQPHSRTHLRNTEWVGWKEYCLRVGPPCLSNNALIINLLPFVRFVACACISLSPLCPGSRLLYAHLQSRVKSIGHTVCSQSTAFNTKFTMPPTTGKPSAEGQ